MMSLGHNEFNMIGKVTQRQYDVHIYFVLDQNLFSDVRNIDKHLLVFCPSNMPKLLVDNGHLIRNWLYPMIMRWCSSWMASS